MEISNREDMLLGERLLQQMRRWKRMSANRHFTKRRYRATAMNRAQIYHACKKIT
jgi:capsule polysaccharide export protein KpsC/LpsZ